MHCCRVRRRIDAANPFQAVYGVNKFLVTYPALVKQQFPQHVANTTLYGRLANSKNIVNLDVEFDHNEQVCVPELVPVHVLCACSLHVVTCIAVVLHCIVV